MAEPKRSAYSEKLRDPRWQKLRLQVFERDGWVCCDCGDTKSTLAVHHKYYEKGKEPWDYPLDALATLCEFCHQIEYERRRAYEDALLHALRAKGFFARDLEPLTAAVEEMPLPDCARVVAGAVWFALRDEATVKGMVERYLAYMDVEIERLK